MLTGQVRYALWVVLSGSLVVYWREGGNRAGWIQRNRRNDHNTSNLQVADLRIGTNWMGRKVFCQQRTSNNERNIEKAQKCKGKTNEKDDTCNEARGVDLAGREAKHTRGAKESGKERNEGKREEMKRMEGVAMSSFVVLCGTYYVRVQNKQ